MTKNIPAVLNIDTDKSKYVEIDYEKSRATLHELIDNGKEILSLAMQVANDTEHPQAIQSAALVLKTISESNDKLMRLNQSYKDYFKKDDRHRIDDMPQDNSPKQITNNYNLFSGTVSELQQKLLDLKQIESSPNKIIDISPS